MLRGRRSSWDIGRVIADACRAVPSQAGPCRTPELGLREQGSAPRFQRPRQGVQRREGAARP